MVIPKMVKTEKTGYPEIRIFLISFIAILAFLLGKDIPHTVFLILTSLILSVGVGLYQHYQVQGMEENDKVWLVWLVWYNVAFLSGQHHRTIYPYWV